MNNAVISTLVGAQITGTNSFLLRTSKVVVCHNSKCIRLAWRGNVLFVSLSKWRLNVCLLQLLILLRDVIGTDLSIRGRSYHLLRYRLLRSCLVDGTSVFISYIGDSGKYKT